MVLDFAYSYSVETVLRNDAVLSCEVISFAHRLGVKELTSIAADLACSQATVESCLLIFEIFKYGCDQKLKMVNFIARWFEEVGRSPDFNTTTIEDLGNFESSEEEVVTQTALFEIILSWLKKNPR